MLDQKSNKIILKPIKAVTLNYILTSLASNFLYFFSHLVILLSCCLLAILITNQISSSQNFPLNKKEVVLLLAFIVVVSFLFSVLRLLKTFPSNLYFSYAFDKFHNLHDSYLTITFPSSESNEHIECLKNYTIDKIKSIKKFNIFKIKIPSILPISIIAIGVIIFYLLSLNSAETPLPQHSFKKIDTTIQDKIKDKINPEKIIDFEKFLNISPEIKEKIKQQEEQSGGEGENNKKTDDPLANKDPSNSGYGNETDPNLLGDPERHNVKKKPEYVDPLLGKGNINLKDKLLYEEGQNEKKPALQESDSFRKYYPKYKKLAEETLEKETFSESSKELVRKYFDVIKK